MLMVTILYRSFSGVEDELEIMKKYFYLSNNRNVFFVNDFYCTESRTADVCKNSLIVGRYSVLPFYDLVEEDMRLNGSKLINSYRQHRYIADLRHWYDDLSGLTPKTWRFSEQLPENKSFILKGETNSKKFLWDTHMFAKDKNDVSRVYCNLQDDSLLSTQDIYVREYVPLETYCIGLHGLPVTKEFRFFVLDGKVIAGGFYWSSYTEELGDRVPKVEEVPVSFLNEVISKIGDKAMFYVIDVAKTKSGDWIVIELNDGQMSGLSDVVPDELYSNLKKNLTFELFCKIMIRE